MIKILKGRVRDFSRTLIFIVTRLKMVYSNDKHADI